MTAANRLNVPLVQAVAADLEAMLGDDFDAETFWDTLDGETDVLDVADAVIARMLDDDALAAAISEQAKALAARAKRIEARAAAHKRALLTILDAAGQKKMERPRATISRRAGALSVRILDEADLPSQLLTVKTVTAPDKKAIREHIEAGESVPGAELTRGDDTVSVRVA